MQSGLEKQWLEFDDKNRFRLPSPSVNPWLARALISLTICLAVVAIYVDGPVHDFPERAERDVAIRERMEDNGWLVIRFHHAEEWLAVAQKYPSVFGGSSGTNGQSGAGAIKS